MRIFLAGASGVIGIRLVPLLVAAGHDVAGMTRSPAKMNHLRDLGAEPVLCDVYDADTLTAAVEGFRPDLVMHQLTDLPDDIDDISRSADRNDRIRREGTRNLLAAAQIADVNRFSAQSIAWELPAERGIAYRAIRELSSRGWRCGDPVRTVLWLRHLLPRRSAATPAHTHRRGCQPDSDDIGCASWNRRTRRVAQTTGTMEKPLP